MQHGNVVSFPDPPYSAAAPVGGREFQAREALRSRLLPPHIPDWFLKHPEPRWVVLSRIEIEGGESSYSESRLVKIGEDLLPSEDTVLLDLESALSLASRVSRPSLAFHVKEEDGIAVVVLRDAWNSSKRSLEPWADSMIHRYALDSTFGSVSCLDEVYDGVTFWFHGEQPEETIQLSLPDSGRIIVSSSLTMPVSGQRLRNSPSMISEAGPGLARLFEFLLESSQTLQELEGRSEVPEISGSPPHAVRGLRCDKFCKTSLVLANQLFEPSGDTMEAFRRREIQNLPDLSEEEFRKRAGLRLESPDDYRLLHALCVRFSRANGERKTMIFRWETIARLVYGRDDLKGYHSRIKKALERLSEPRIFLIRRDGRYRCFEEPLIRCEKREEGYRIRYSELFDFKNGDKQSYVPFPEDFLERLDQHYGKRAHVEGYRLAWFLRKSNFNPLCIGKDKLIDLMGMEGSRRDRACRRVEAALEALKDIGVVVGIRKNRRNFYIEMRKGTCRASDETKAKKR